MAVALILLLVAVGSVLFHIFSPWWWTPLASNWGYIDHTITPDVLDHRGGFLRGRRVHGLLRLPLSPQGGKAGRLQSRKQEARIVADDRDCDRRRGHAGTRAGRLAPVRHRSGRCDRGRGHGTAVAMELPASRKGRPAWDLRCPQCQFRQSDGVESRRSSTDRTTSSFRTTICTCRLGSR